MTTGPASQASDGAQNACDRDRGLASPEVSTPEIASRVRALDTIRARVMNVVGHELRTPITTLRGLAETLATAPDDQIRGEIAPAIVRSARRVERLLDDLLVASGIETALPVDAPAPVPLRDLIAEAWTAGDGVPGDLVVDVSPSVAVLMPPFAARRLVEALLDNAAKYGSAPMSITGHSAEGRVQISVDTPGPALPDAEIELAVEPFFRGERAVMTTPGFGLGLPIARALARQVGGDLTVAARDGGGVVTVVELPVA